MKKLTFAHALIATLLASNISTGSFAQNILPTEGSTNTGGITGDEGGTNVGGYTPAEGSTNVGGSEDGISIYSMNPWNSGILRTVKRTKQSATDNFADNKLESAIKIYQLQLEKISLTASIPEYQLSWTKKIADRSLNLASSLDSSIKNPNDRIAIFNVYATTYDLIEEFYTKLDLAYTIPYRQNGKKKDFHLDLVGYEQQLNHYLTRQGAWFTQRFVASNDKDGTIPKYSPTVFLVALSSLSKGLAMDLLTDSVTGPNLFPHQYESIASQLGGIAEDIDQHLAGGSVFGGLDSQGKRRDDRAINESYKTFLEVMSSLTIK